MSGRGRPLAFTPEDDARILRAYRAMDRYGAMKALAERFRRSPAAIGSAIKRAQQREAVRA